MHILTDDLALASFGIFFQVALLNYCCLDTCLKKNKKNRLAGNTETLIKWRLKKKISDEFISMKITRILRNMLEYLFSNH